VPVTNFEDEQEYECEYSTPYRFTFRVVSIVLVDGINQFVTMLLL